MLCAGLKLAEKIHPRTDSLEPAKARGRRLEIVRDFEKLWALACGLAEEKMGVPAVDGLRGIRYVRRFLQSNAGRSELSIGDYNLLQNQVRYGGIGTYGQMLESCHFTDWSKLTLRPLGEKLADSFPTPPSWMAERPNARFSRDSLRVWGEAACVEKMSVSEAQTMREGLKGSLEAELDDDVRWTSLLLLKKAGAGSGSSEADCLKVFNRLVQSQPLGDARQARALRQLRVVASLVEPLEQFYQALIFLFDGIRIAATENPSGCSLLSLNSEREMKEAFVAAQQSSQNLSKALSLSEQIEASVSSSIQQAMRDSGILTLAEEIIAAAHVAEAASILSQRHVSVQSGRFDRGQQKSPWVRIDAGQVRLSSQRNELLRSQRVKTWKQTLRHPYRVDCPLLR